ncbi:MAG: F420-dependent methylene-tetrahydromethanopterin reductase [Rhodospirillaceae bacterium]|nr:F420-dependent methylene-tetrahydromethanopterin reductase [Rhodospirillaceae bacterium]
MKFGIFGGARQKRGLADTDSPTGYRDWIDYNIEAEALGFCSSFTTEHHFTGLGQVSASLNLMTYLAAKTTTLRLGTAVMTLPWHNPVLLAEQAATLDLVSEGRLDFGVGKEYRYNEFHGFGVDMVDADEIFEEALALILKSWQTEERWSHTGKHWQFNEIVVEPPTVQEPHPPIWLAAGRPDSIRAAARRGAHLLLDQYSPLHAVFERAEIFRDELRQIGVDPQDRQIALARGLFIAKDAAEKADVIARRTKARDLVDQLAETPDGDNAASIMQFKGPEEAVDGALIGTLDEIADRLEVIRQSGIEYVLLSNAGGGAAGLRQFSEAFI